MEAVLMPEPKDPRDAAEELLDLFVRNLAKAITYTPVSDAIKAGWIKTRQEWRVRKPK
jgi:hypothetical protein